MGLAASIAERYPYEGEAGDEIRAPSLRVCREQIELGLADNNGEQRLCADDHYVF